MKRKRHSHPTRKISETILEFVAPIAEIMDDSQDQSQWDTAVRIGLTVWNAVVFDDAIGQGEYMERLRRDTKKDPSFHALVEQLVARKRELFAADHRLVGNFTVGMKDGGVHLWAEARDPYTIGPKDGSRTRRST